MSNHPVAERVSLALMLAGTAVAVVSVTAWVLNVLPPATGWMAALAIYKLTLASGAGLMIAGATLRRTVRLKAAREQQALAEGNTE